MALDHVRPSFRVDCDPWIPVLYADGSLREVSLRDLIVDAHRIRDIVPDMPQQKMPILRLALAVLYRAYDFSRMGEREMLDAWGEMWDEGCFAPADIDAYFEGVAGGFDLFDPERPFFQTAGLSYTDAAGRDYSSIGEIIADCTKLFAMRDRTVPNGISYAEAARWLVFMQAYDLAGIKTPVVGNTFVKMGKVYPPKDSVGTGWMGAIGGVCLRGANLFETLALNWVLYDSRAQGRSHFADLGNLPPWERPSRPNPADVYESYATGENPGVVELYTWQSRRVRLIPNAEGTAVIGIVSCYGDILRPIQHEGFEPMTRWAESKPQQKKYNLPEAPLMPVRHVAGRSLWRGFASLLALGEGGADGRPGVVRWLDQVRNREFSRPIPPIALCAQGITYGTQNSVVEDAVDDSFDVGNALYDAAAGSVEQAVATIEKTEEGVRAFVAFARSVDEISGNRHTDSSVNAMRERAYGELDGLFRRRIARFSVDEDPLAYGAAWRRETHGKLLDLAREYVALVGVSRFDSHMSSGSDWRRMTVSEAMGRYRGQLARIFEPLLPPREDAPSADEEGR